MALTRKQKAFRKRWVAALRSGEYRQTRGELRDAAGFCCLGVACDISGTGKWDGPYYRPRRGLPRRHFPPHYVATLFGIDGALENALSELNDADHPGLVGVPTDFLEIADTIDLLTWADSE